MFLGHKVHLLGTLLPRYDLTWKATPTLRRAESPACSWPTWTAATARRQPHVRPEQEAEGLHRSRYQVRCTGISFGHYALI